MSRKLHVLRPTGQAQLKLYGELCVTIRGDRNGLEPDAQRRYRHDFFLLANCEGFGLLHCEPIIAVVDAYKDDQLNRCDVIQAATYDEMTERLDRYDPTRVIDPGDHAFIESVVDRFEARRKRFVDEIKQKMS